jgi:hypothetical protein
MRRHRLHRDVAGCGGYASQAYAQKTGISPARIIISFAGTFRVLKYSKILPLRNFFVIISFVSSPRLSDEFAKIYLVIFTSAFILMNANSCAARAA